MRAAAASGVSLAHLRLSVIPSLICSSPSSTAETETETEREREREGEGGRTAEIRNSAGGGERGTELLNHYGPVSPRGAVTRLYIRHYAPCPDK